MPKYFIKTGKVNITISFIKIMYKITLFILIFAGVLFSQTWKETPDIIDDFDYIVSDEDSITLNDSDDLIYITDAETLYILVPNTKSNGNWSVWGYATDTTGAADTLWISGSPYRGDRATLNTSFTYTWTSLATVAIDSLGTTSFDIHLQANATLKTYNPSFFVLRFRGSSGTDRKIYLKYEENKS